MIVYIGLLIIFFLILDNHLIIGVRRSSNYSLNAKKRYRLCVIILIVFSAIRYRIGYDWDNYRQIIELGRYRLYQKEPISELIFFLGYLCKTPLVSFAIFSGVIYGFVSYAIWENSKDRGKSLILYIALFYFESLSSIRSAAAIAIVFWGLRYIRQHNIIKYFIVCLIAACFHNIALLGLIVYFVFWMKKSMAVIFFPAYYLLGQICVSKMIRLFSGVDIIDKNLRLLNNDVSGNGYKMIFIAFTLYCIILLYVKSNRRFKLDEFQSGCLNCCLTGIAFPFFLGGVIGIRIASLFCIYLTLLWAEADMSIKKKQRWITFLPIVACFCGVLIIIAYQGDAYVPYRSYFDLIVGVVD